MSQVRSRFRTPKTFDGKMRVFSILFRNLRFTRPNERHRLFENGKARIERGNKICTIEPGGVFKGEDIGLDVQELTENKNARSLTYWLGKFEQELQISRVRDIPLGRFTILSAGKNAKNALNPLPDSDKRYH